ncbi:MAG: phosphate regulon sensor histidine kinase PhoR [Gammaproteobacteria bacterium]|nr:phosphate regulon sensor histidine kinase PhoR [Gammaproteobacteria bacterium]
MTLSSNIQRELVFLVAWVLFMLALGAIFGLALPALFLAMVLYILWHMHNLNRLLLWLSKPTNNTPESMGVWDEAFFKLHNQYIRHRTSRKKLTKMLKRFQRSTKAMPFATIVLNSNNEIEWFNPASKLLFGLRSRLDIGQRIDNLIRQPEFIKYLSNKDFTKSVEFENQQKKISLSIIKYGNGQYLLSASDITQRTKLDEMRRNFISNASHELRTPLTVISGYVEILQDTADQTNKFSIDKIHQQTVRMEKIISELIELAKLETSVGFDKHIDLDMSKLLTEVFNEAVSLDQNKHTLLLDIKDLQITGIYEEIRTAISNLLTNAIRYTPEGGEITLSTSTDESGAYIHVKDNGIGISYEHIARLTERFYRVDEGRSREKGGTGLGLAIVKQILDLHNATLLIESLPGKGSQFSCFFPVVEH